MSTRRFASPLIYLLLFFFWRLYIQQRLRICRGECWGFMTINGLLDCTSFKSFASGRRVCFAVTCVVGKGILLHDGNRNFRHSVFHV
jgi:hypothetical protein